MNRSTGSADATYALLASVAMMAGLLLLSVAGTPFSLMEGSGPQASLDPQDLDIPENGSIDPSEYVDQETAQDAAEAAADSGAVESIARSLFELLSGQYMGSPGDGLSNGTVNGTRDGNRTDGSGNTTGDGADAGSGNETSTDGNQTDPDDGQTTDGNETTDGNQTTGEDQTGTDGNDTGAGQQPSGNETDDGGQQDDGGDDRQGQDDTNSSDGEDGFLQGLMDGLSSVFNGSDGSQESPTEPDSNRSGTGSDTGQDTGSDDTQQDDAGAGQEDGPLLDRLWEIAPYLLALALLIVAVMFYRSDADARTFLARLLERLRRFITTIPDLFRRLVVDTISVLIAKVRAMYRFIIRLARRPVLTLRELDRSLRERVQDAVTASRRLRERGVRGCVDALRGKDTDRDRDGLDRLWHRLKQELGLGDTPAVTPAEVRELALRDQLPRGPVDELVEAFRQEKYTADGYPGTIDMEAWERTLWGEDDG